MSRLPNNLLAIAIAASPAILYAQSPCPAIAQPLCPQSIERSVITATLVQTRAAAPASVTVLHADSLRARGLTHLSDALRLVPGAALVQSSSVGSQTSLFMRGGQANYVRVLLDGAPLNEPGGALDLGGISLDNIERIEVVRGPASVLYGADAVTGVIRLFSRHSSKQSGSLSLGGGSFGGRDVSARGSTGGTRLSGDLSVAEHRSDGILAYNNGFVNRSLGAGLHLLPDARTEATLSANWTASTYHYPTESDGTLGDRNAENTDHRFAVTLDGRRVLSDRFTASWTLSSIDHSPRANDGPDTPADTLGFYGYFSRGTVTRRLADLRLAARFASVDLAVGASVARDHERNSSLSLSEYGPSPSAFEAARNERALYAQGVGTFASRGTWQMGVRLDDNAAFGTFTTYRVAGAWALSDAWRVRGATGTAFRAPTFYENYATGWVRGNPSLVPERTQSAELGVEGRIGVASLSVTGYRQRFHDLIQYNGATAAPTDPNYINIAAANADGAELELRAPIGAGLTTNLVYAISRTRVTDAGVDHGAGANMVLGQPLIRRPARTARMELARALGSRGSVIAGAAYTGRTADRNFAAYPSEPVWLSAHTLVDAAVTWRLTTDDARLPVTTTLRGDNLGGVSYQGIYGFRAPGRMVRVGVQIGR